MRSGAERCGAWNCVEKGSQKTGGGNAVIYDLAARTLERHPHLWVAYGVDVGRAVVAAVELQIYAVRNPGGGGSKNAARKGIGCGAADRGK